MAKISWIIASIIVLISGVLHVYGIFFSEDLYPEDMEILMLLKSSNVQMDKSGNLWKLWIGFNAMFGVSLIFMGSIILNLSIKHFPFLCKQHFVLLLNILSMFFFVWVGHTYMIKDFVLAMLVPLVLFMVGYTSIVLKRSN